MLDDEQIIEGCIKKDAQCQSMLYKKYAASLYVIALRYTVSKEDAQDVLHDAFLKIFDNIKQFSVGEKKGTLLGWLTRIVINQALAQHKMNTKVVYSDECVEEISDKSVIQSDKLTHKILLDFIRDLPHNCRIVFNLCGIEGYSYEEAAKMLNFTGVNCRVQMSRAKNILREKVNNFMEKENKK